MPANNIFAGLRRESPSFKTKTTLPIANNNTNQQSQLFANNVPESKKGNDNKKTFTILRLEKRGKLKSRVKMPYGLRKGY